MHTTCRCVPQWTLVTASCMPAARSSLQSPSAACRAGPSFHATQGPPAVQSAIECGNTACCRPPLQTERPGMWLAGAPARCDAPHARQSKSDQAAGMLQYQTTEAGRSRCCLKRPGPTPKTACDMHKHIDWQCRGCAISNAKMAGWWMECNIGCVYG